MIEQKKSAMRRWDKVLASSMGRPIKTRLEAACLSALMDTQLKLNKGALPESANVSADVAQYQQYALPLIRRQFPELLAMNTVSVIPTTTPQGIYFALRYLYDNEPRKTTAFRRGMKQEIGYDLVADHTGFKGFMNPWSVSEGEMLSNYMEGTANDGSALDPAYLRNHVNGTVDGDAYSGYAYNIKRASIKVISGAIRVGTRAIKSHYTLELQQDMAAAHGQDVEALLLEGLQFEIQQEIDREILMAMVKVAQDATLGGEDAIQVDLATIPDVIKGRWAAEGIAGAIVNTIIAVGQKISLVNRMGSANFGIVSPDICAAVCTLNGGIYQPSYLGTNVEQLPAGGVADAGTIINAGIKLYKDIYAAKSYCLLGYKGPRSGESGIIMMPYIPYIFTKTAGQEDGSPRLIVKSRYAIVANLLGAGQFYRVIQFSNVNKLLLGIDLSAAKATFQNNADVIEPGLSYDTAPAKDAKINGVGGMTFDGEW